MSSSACIIAIEGVLCDPTHEMPNAAPIAAGLDLYGALATTWRALVVSTRSTDKRGVADWFNAYHLPQPVWIAVGCTDLDTKIANVQTAVGKLLAKPSFYIDCDPAATAYMASHGVPTLMFMHPRETLLDWSTRSRSSWRQEPVADEETVS